MNRPLVRIATALIVFAVMSCKDSVVGPVAEHAVEMKGFSYTSFTADGFQQGHERQAEEKLKVQTGSSWVSLCVFEYQTSPTSADIAPNISGMNPVTGFSWPTTSTEADIRVGVQSSRAQNMHVLLKPQIDLYTGEWRASITPDFGGLWFRSYTAMIKKYARLAEELHIEMLCIGSEFIAATQPLYTSNWRQLIRGVRQVYSGKLTYAANWSGDFAHGLTQPEYRQVGFWSDLDDIGIDAYYPLTDSPSDTIPAFDAAVRRVVNDVELVGTISNLYAKPVIMTEIGIQSVEGALAAPWDYARGSSTSAVRSDAVQEFYYRVMIDAIGKQPWCSGMFWWNWESVTTANVGTNYTPEDKAASQVVRRWYLRERLSI